MVATFNDHFIDEKTEPQRGNNLANGAAGGVERVFLTIVRLGSCSIHSGTCLLCPSCFPAYFFVIAGDSCPSLCGKPSVGRVDRCCSRLWSVVVMESP